MLYERRGRVKERRGGEGERKGGREVVSEGGGTTDYPYHQFLDWQTHVLQDETSVSCGAATDEGGGEECDEGERRERRGRQHGGGRGDHR